MFWFCFSSQRRKYTDKFAAKKWGSVRVRVRVRMRVTATKITFSVIKANDFPIDMSQQVIGFGVLENVENF